MKMKLSMIYDVYDVYDIYDVHDIWSNSQSNISFEFDSWSG